MTRETLARLGHAVTEEQHARLARFVDALAEQAQLLNLTSIREPDRIWELHVCDSLALRPLLRNDGPLELLDLGCGGGVPGIPLACVAERLRVTLMDATKKKVDACARIVEACELKNAATCWGRAETLAHEPARRESFDVVTARAVAALPVLCELAAGFVRPGGLCCFMKSTDIEQERAAARAAAKTCRLRALDDVRYALPEPHGERLVTVFEKVGPLPAGLPRAAGKPAQSPLR